MKTIVQAVCLMLLLGGSFAVWGADDKRRLPAPSGTSKSKLEIRPAATGESKPKLFATSAKNELPATKGETPEKTSPVKATNVSQSTDVSTSVKATSAVPTKAALLTTPAVVASENQVRLSLDTLTPTAEMWFYEQMRQDYNNPQLQARRRAEWNAAQRRARIAAREWYGYSNSRPSVHVTPFTYHYSAAHTPTTYVASARYVPFFAAARAQTSGWNGIGWW